MMTIEERLNKEKQIKCPRCKVYMSKIISPNRQFIIDECNKCGGRWLDKNEIGHMKKMSFFQYIKLWFQK